MEKTCHFTIERDEQNPLRVIKRCGKKYRGSNLYCEEHQSQLPISQAENSENREMKCVFVVKRDQQNRVIERCYKSYQGNPNSMDSLFCEEHRAISRLVPKDPIIQAEK
jgi:hypothetical protein